MIIRDTKPAAPPSELRKQVMAFAAEWEAKEAAKTAPARRLEELEGIIQTERDLGRRHNAAYIEAGKALKEVRDSKLYKESYGTFEEYCERRWKFKADYARKLIGASTSALELPEPERPKTEGEARKSFKNRQKIATKCIDFKKTNSTESTIEPIKDKPKSVPKSEPRPAEDPRVKRWSEAMAKINGAKDQEGFLETVEEMLENWGL